MVEAISGGKKMIPIFRPSMGEEEIEAVAEVLKSGWIGIGPKTEEFEEQFAEYIGTKYAVALNSCTAALHLALNVLGINSGEVITTPITFVSTAHAILYNNASPVFADVQEDTLNIDPHDIERKITGKTKAIIPVHYGGHVCDMDEILDIAGEHNLYVIEDAAHACGAEYKRKKAGSLSDIGCFSFHAVKNLATGDGGMITTNDKTVYEKLLELRWLGINKSTYQRDTKGYSWYYDVESVGFKMHMNDITAAIGLVQLGKLDNMNARRHEIVKRYNETFADLNWIETPIEKDYAKSSLHNYAIKVKKGDRNELITHLADKGVSAGVHYMPLYMHSIYKKLGIKGDCPVADSVWRKVVILPLYPDMTEEDVKMVVEGVKEFGLKL
ncbi:MAG TPA: DegT/DnrJ/EryC1/StrS aminotransferase family protein [Methanophagales archaeon]|nr:DegT/DnrJ/EryC1/StrS aminotransferase family protein [Methanophagales archaeon]